MSSSVVFSHWTEWFGERRNNSHTDINRVYNIHTIYIIYMQSHESNSQLLPLYRNYVNQEQEIMILKEGSYGNFGPLQSSWVQFLPDFLWGSCCLILVFFLCGVLGILFILVNIVLSSSSIYDLGLPNCIYKLFFIMKIP